MTFNQLFNAVEKFYSQLVKKSSISTPVSKSISFHSSSSDKRRKSNDHEKFGFFFFSLKVNFFTHFPFTCKIECHQLNEINCRQTDRSKMLEDEYEKFEDGH